ncbi:hypothetical protein [Clostridium sp. C8-1-8]|uniref:hypothetical protein n=1 Tax=Clostridium sp. C8-1-8 TaxID=2698831 RepID=UPI0013716D05|nr:hypothetical protein [Clostridium sp. C8-1-8]
MFKKSKKKGFIASGILALAIMGTSNIAYAMNNSGTYDLKVPVFGGISTYDVTKSDGNASYAFNSNTSTSQNFRLYSNIERSDTSEQIASEDSFSSGGWSKMSYNGRQSWYYGYRTRMHIYSGKDIWVPVYTKGEWTPDCY